MCERASPPKRIKLIAVGIGIPRWIRPAQALRYDQLYIEPFAVIPPALAGGGTPEAVRTKYHVALASISEQNVLLRSRFSKLVADIEGGQMRVVGCSAYRRDERTSRGRHAPKRMPKSKNSMGWRVVGILPNQRHLHLAPFGIVDIPGCLWSISTYPLNFWISRGNHLLWGSLRPFSCRSIAGRKENKLGRFTRGAQISTNGDASAPPNVTGNRPTGPLNLANCPNIAACRFTY